VDISVRAVGAEHRRTAQSLVQHGLVLLQQGQLDDAESAIRRGLEFQLSHLPPQHAETAVSHATLGELLLNRGRFAAAEHELHKARAIFERPEVGDLARLDDVLRLLGLCAAALGRVDEGAALIRKSIERMQGRLPADHWRVLAAQGLLLTPPFVSRTQAEDDARLAQIRQTLVTRLGPGAPPLRAIERRMVSR
jgi:tetratricopeptide (TPR) repeat protein